MASLKFYPTLTDELRNDAGINVEKYIFSYLYGGEECGKIKELFQTDRFNRLVIERKGGETVYHATLNTGEEISSARLQEIMAENPFIKSLERCDEG